MLVSLVLGLGLEHSCLWPRECLSSEKLSLASDFFVSLALASSLVSSTPPLETETEETIGFFVHGEISIGGARVAEPMLQLRKTKKVLANFPRGFWHFPTKFQRFKNSAVLELRTGQFSRT